VYRDWEVYKGDNGSTGYSSLDQINKDNVNQLEVAWIYNSGFESNSGSECNPIVIDDRMYLITPGLKAAALEAATGKLIWLFDPFEGEKNEDVSRAVTYWEDGDDKRIFFTPGFKLCALDAETGKPISTFGKDGTVDIRSGKGNGILGNSHGES
jgi:quinoprotein glucose dehydrogenase